MLYLHTGRMAQAAADPLADELTSCIEVLIFPSNGYKQEKTRYQYINSNIKSKPSKGIFTSKLILLNEVESQQNQQNVELEQK